MKIAVGSDHGGFALKEAVKKHLEAKGIEVEDFGCYSTESVDYAVYGAKVAHCVADGKADPTRQQSLHHLRLLKWQNSRFRDNRAEADKLLRWKPAQNLSQLLIVNEQSSNNPTDQCQIHWQPAGF